MTTFNINQIPASVQTLEELAAWCGIALNNINPTKVAIEGTNVNQRAAQAGFFYIDTDNKHRLLVRLSLEVDPAYLAGGEKLWTFVQPLSETALPTIFTA